jgi:hypothetical protein
MTIYFSAHRRGFFDGRFHDALPADAVAISDDQYRQLLDAQAAGAAIDADASGLPKAATPARPTLSALRAATIEKVKAQASRRILAISPLWQQMNDLRLPTDDGDARFARIDAIRHASDAIEADVAAMSARSIEALDLATHIAWPE